MIGEKTVNGIHTSIRNDIERIFCAFAWLMENRIMEGNMDTQNVRRTIDENRYSPRCPAW
jgi:hypothetical protein